MVSKSLLAVFLVACVLIVHINGQLCSPKGVEKMSLTMAGMLLWEPPDDNACAINYYLVHIHNENGQREYYFATPSLMLNITFLPICEKYTFIIVAVSTEGIRGAESDHVAKIPFPLDADLTISAFSVASRDTGVHLEWQVADEWRKCADRYRVTIYDTESDNPTDLYVNSNDATINSLIPCTAYTFGVRAIYNLESEGPFTSTRYSTPSAGISAPALQAITVGSTTADLAWQVESYSLNKCPISSLTVDASPSFRITYPITDQVNRPPVSVRLTNLQPDTMYLLNVTATNSFGVSAPALLAVQTRESNS